MNDRKNKASRNRKLRVEQLCSRQLLAGDMTNPIDALDANNSGGVTAGDALAIINYMTIAAEGEQAGSVAFPDTNGDNKVSAGDALRIITHLGEAERININLGGAQLNVDVGRSIRVNFTGNNTTVNVSTPIGQTGNLTFTSGGQSRTVAIKDDLIINATGNGNRLIFNRADIPDDLVINVNGDNNAVQMIRTYVGEDFIYRGGSGIDGVFVDLGTKIVGNLDVNTKGGNDAVFFRLANIDHDATVRTEGGDDFFAIQSANVHDDAVVRLGSGADFASIVSAYVNDRADIDGESGTDTLAVNAASLAIGRLRQEGFEATGTLVNLDAVLSSFGL